MYDLSRELPNMRTIAVKEFRDNVQSRRFIVIGFFYLLLTLVIALLTLVHDPAGRSLVLEIIGRDQRPSAVLGVIEYLKLNMVLTLLAVIVSADALSLERKDRTIYQLLSKPVERSTVVAGKFIGCLAVLATLFVASAVMAYGLTALLNGIVPSPGDVVPFGLAIVAEVLLLAVYLAIGLVVSAVTKNPFISIAGAFFVWVILLITSLVGNAVGLIAAASRFTQYMGDTFSLYPWYAQLMVQIDPMSHGMMTNIVNGSYGPVVNMPLPWNALFLLAYAGALLVGSIVLFRLQDIS